MSINKIIILFALMLILLGAFVFVQFTNKTGSHMKPNAKMAFNAKTIDIEIVTTDKDKEIGLTKYPSISDNQGMLFIFEKPLIPSFWMKNMKFPIDMVFLNGDTVVSFTENAKVPTSDKEFEIYKPEALADSVLEINAGLIKKYNINKGDRVKVTKNEK